MFKLITNLFVLFFCCGCASLPLQQEQETRELIINNPEHIEVELKRVGGESITLGTDSSFQLDLQVSRYVVVADGLSYPAPLVAEVLPKGKRLTINLVVQPQKQSGFVFVPGGPSLIGDVLGVGAADERPARIEEISPLFVAEFETTNAQYVDFLNAKGMCDKDWIDLGGPKCLVRESRMGIYETDSPNFPIVTVTLEGALEYCKWKSASTGMTVRLPTEIEWEKIARGPMSTTYSYGDVYDPEAANQESGRLVATKTFSPTGWGVYDTTGNAFEWTSSEYTPGLTVLKGGSYVLDGPYLRNSFRMWYRPLVQADDIGFRVVQEIRK